MARCQGFPHPRKYRKCRQGWMQWYRPVAPSLRLRSGQAVLALIARGWDMVRSTADLIKQPTYFFAAFRRRSADCANRLASTLNSRLTCEMENFSERASLRHVQCSE